MIEIGMEDSKNRTGRNSNDLNWHGGLEKSNRAGLGMIERGYGMIGRARTRERVQARKGARAREGARASEETNTSEIYSALRGM